MVKSKGPKLEPSRWIRRCLLCWAAPLVFLCFAPHLESDDRVGALAILVPLVGTIATSLAGLTATFLGCPVCPVAAVQLFLQLAILLFAHGFLEFASAAEPSRNTFQHAAVVSRASGFLGRKEEIEQNKEPGESGESGKQSGIPLKADRGRMSVVLPCLNEPFALKTVMRFCERTPAEAGPNPTTSHNFIGDALWWHVAFLPPFFFSVSDSFRISFCV